MGVIEHVSDDKQAKLRVQDITKVEDFIYIMPLLLAVWLLTLSGWTALCDKLARQTRSMYRVLLMTSYRVWLWCDVIDGYFPHFMQRFSGNSLVPAFGVLL